MCKYACSTIRFIAILSRLAGSEGRGHLLWPGIVPEFAEFEYDVVKGGYELGIDCWIEPDEEIDLDEPQRYRKIFNSRRHQGGRFKLPWNGRSYRLCFSNHFSTSTDKLVYFSVETTREALPKIEQSSDELFTGALENLDYSYRLLKYIAATTQQDGGVIAAAGGRIQFWSSCFTIVLIVTAALQTYAIKSDFIYLDRRGSTA
ncbi:unnamed protein product [Oikopleura dioica]|uniref:GOLD domain-containing protein n=1 Tax=Oikopleura dioica TaxID=34765 RepID=E4Z2A4_OIKDI|nr:unnamed protein product [Oikopleura dioica]